MNTDLENRREDWITDHIGMCGTCYYRENTVCRCESSDWCDDRVTNNFGCGEYIPERGLMI